MNTSERFSRTIDLPPLPEVNEDYLPENVEVHLHFGPHSKAEHLDGIRELMPEADIVIPEVPYWDDKLLRTFVAISKGNKKIFDRFSHNQKETPADWRLEFLRIIYNTYKSVTIIDIADRQRGLLPNNGNTNNLLARIAPTMEETLDRFADHAAEMTQSSGIRDRIMIESLGQNVTKLVANHPRLRERPRVRAVGAFGSMHQPLYDALHRSPVGDRVTTSNWEGAGEIDPETTVYLTYKDGDTPTRSQMLRFMTMRALHLLPSPHVPGEQLINPDRFFTKKPDPHVVTGLKMVDLISDEENGDPEMAFDILRTLDGLKHKQKLIEYLDQAVALAK